MRSAKNAMFKFLLGGMLALGTGLTGCYNNDGDTADLTILLRSTGSGSQERPNPVSTAALGTMTGRYIPETRQFRYTISWNRLSANPNAMHFHGPATPQEVAPPVVPITGFPVSTSGSVSNTVTLTPEQGEQLLAGLWYFNIHTINFPGGEVRGQVMVGR